MGSEDHFHIAWCSFHLPLPHLTDSEGTSISGKINQNLGLHSMSSFHMTAGEGNCLCKMSRVLGGEDLKIKKTQNKMAAHGGKIYRTWLLGICLWSWKEDTKDEPDLQALRLRDYWSIKMKTIHIFIFQMLLTECGPDIKLVSIGIMMLLWAKIFQRSNFMFLNLNLFRRFLSP